jgi:hypothetical protein
MASLPKTFRPKTLKILRKSKLMEMAITKRLKKKKTKKMRRRK